MHLPHASPNNRRTAGSTHAQNPTNRILIITVHIGQPTPYWLKAYTQTVDARTARYHVIALTTCRDNNRIDMAYTIKSDLDMTRAPWSDK